MFIYFFTKFLGKKRFKENTHRIKALTFTLNLIKTNLYLKINKCI